MPDSRNILYSAGKNDECKTPAYAVEPLREFIPIDVTIWCPFDQPDSQFVQVLGEHNKVIHSHIHDGQNFYIYEPDDIWHVMISNPPFTNKRLIFERALSFYKPICLLMTMVWLNDVAPTQVFSGFPFELLMFDQRILFECNGSVNKRITFKSGYYCSRFLPEKLMTRELDKEAIKAQKNGQ